MEKFVNKLMIARFPYGGSEAHEVGDWLVKTVLEAKQHPNIDPDGIFKVSLNDTPITMTRNAAVKLAKDSGADLLLMVDSDMEPDRECWDGQTFFKSSLDFMMHHSEPCIVAAPYCGPPPYSPVFVFRWTSGMNLEDNANPHWRLEMVPREEAASWSGIVEAAALATGLILIDMKVFDRLAHPYFAYEWKDETQSEKATTEDVYFTRNASLAGIPCFCNWDCWAGHKKSFTVGKPRPIFVDQVRAEFAKQLVDRRSNQVFQRVMVKNGEVVRNGEAAKEEVPMPF